MHIPHFHFFGMVMFRVVQNSQLRRSLALVSCRSCATNATSDIPQLIAKIRTTNGSRPSREMRQNEKQVPGVIYGVDEDKNIVKILISVKENDLVVEMKKRGQSLENTLYEIHLPDETKHLVTPRQIQFNPLNDAPLSCNFLKYWPGNRVRIPIEYINEDECPDLKKGCFLVQVNRFLECTCGDVVPATIIVDLAGKQKGSVIRLSDLKIPAGVSPSSAVPADFVAGAIKSGRTK